MSISVIHTSSGSYYYVRVMRRKRLYAKCFKQMRMARRYERELLEQLGPPLSQKGRPKNRQPPNSGEKRIVRTVSRRSGRGAKEVFRVYYRTPEGQPRSTEVSIRLWGEARALARAKRIRREMDRRQMGKS